MAASGIATTPKPTTNHVRQEETDMRLLENNEAFRSKLPPRPGR